MKKVLGIALKDNIRQLTSCGDAWASKNFLCKLYVTWH